MPGGERQAWGQPWQACGARETMNRPLYNRYALYIPCQTRRAHRNRTLATPCQTIKLRARPTRTKSSMAPKGKKRAAPSAPASEWAAVPDAASDSDVLKAVMEVQRFWIHGDTVC